MKNVFPLCLLITYTKSHDYAPGYDPKKDVVDYVKPIYERPAILTKKQFEDFKKEHSNEKIIDMTNSLAIEDQNIPRLFGQGTKFNIQILISNNFSSCKECPTLE